MYEPEKRDGMAGLRGYYQQYKCQDCGKMGGISKKEVRRNKNIYKKVPDGEYYPGIHRRGSSNDDY